jgi:hypothetical protein
VHDFDGFIEDIWVGKWKWNGMEHLQAMFSNISDFFFSFG